MFGWAADAERRQRLLRMVRAITDIKRNAILARLPNPEGPQQYRRIHVWWRGMRDNGDLMLLLAYLLNLNPVWRRATVSIRTIVDSEKDRVEMTAQLDAMINEARIRADSEVIVRPEGKTPTEIIHDSSRNADVVFLGLPIPSPDTEAEIAERLNDLVEGLPCTILVRSAGPYAAQLL